MDSYAQHRQQICDQDEKVFETWARSKGASPVRLGPNGRRRCDYLIEAQNSSCVFEVYSFFGSESVSPAARLISAIHSRLRKLEFGGLLAIQIDADSIVSRVGKGRLSGASKVVAHELRSAIIKRGVNIAQEDVRLPGLGSYKFLPMPERDRLLLVGPSLARMSRAKVLLREALEQKRKQYRGSTEAGRPYVVVVFSHYTGTDLQDVGGALYGDTSFTYREPFKDPPVVWTNAATGFFRRDRNTNVSGLLLHLPSVRESLSERDFGFFENPWARNGGWRSIMNGLAPDNMVGLADEPPAEIGRLTTALNPSVSH